jgi:hypothetical protein
MFKLKYKLVSNEQKDSEIIEISFTSISELSDFLINKTNSIVIIKIEEESTERKDKEYSYFISYVGENFGHSTEGMLRVAREEPIRNMNDVELIANDIRKIKNYNNIVIRNWILFNN